MLPTKLNPLGVSPYDGVMEFVEVENGIYRCYGETTQYQNDGRNLLPLPDAEIVYNHQEGIANATWSIKNNRIKLVSDYTQAAGRFSCLFKLTNGYVPQFMNSTAVKEYFLPPGTYTISMQNKVGGSNNSISPALRLVTTANKTYQVTWGSTTGVTFTTEDPIAYAYINGFNSIIDCEFNIQIEAGSTMTEWKPYTTNPTPTVNNPSPIVSKYPRGRYKTNLPGITIKLDDDLRGIDEYKDYVEVNVATKEKSITRNVKRINTTDDLNYDYNSYKEATNTHLILIRDRDNKWNEVLSTYQAYSSHFCYKAWANANNTFYINRRLTDTLLQCYVIEEYLESLDDDGVKKIFTKYPMEFIYPLSNPITTLL